MHTHITYIQHIEDTHSQEQTARTRFFAGDTMCGKRKAGRETERQRGREGER